MLQGRRRLPSLLRMGEKTNFSSVFSFGSFIDLEIEDNAIW